MRHDQTQLDTMTAARLSNPSDGSSIPVHGPDLCAVPGAIGPSAKDFRNVLGHYASGITIITGMEERGPIGFTCQSFYSVSTEPPLVSFSVQKSSATYPRIRASGSFAVNVLARHQQHMSSQFSRSGTDKWAGIGWKPTQAGNPVLNETMMWLDCRIWAEHDAGDHLIVLGRVEEMGLAEERLDDPLLYFKGRYRQLGAQ